MKNAEVKNTASLMILYATCGYGRVSLKRLNAMSERFLRGMGVV